MADDDGALESLLADLAKGGLKEVVDNSEVRATCRSALRDAGCAPPADTLIYLAVAKLVVLGAGGLSSAYSTRLMAWVAGFPLVGSLLRRIADICIKEQHRNQLKDELVRQLKGESGGPRPEFGDEADLAIVEQVYAMKRFDGIDAGLAELIGLLQQTLALRSGPDAAPRLGWDGGSTKSASDTIRYNSGAYGFVGREDDIAFLHKFLGDPDRFSWLLLTGEGGEGKTRLAMEFTQNRLPPGWVGGKLSIPDLERFDPATWIPARPTCIVIDYPAQSPVQVRALMASLARAADANIYDFPVRVILLERNIAGDWYRELLPPTGEGANLKAQAFSEPSVGGSEPISYDRGRPVRPLEPAELVAMMQQRFGDAGVTPPDPQLLWERLAAVDGNRRGGLPPRPIFAAAIAETLIRKVQAGDSISRETVREMDRIGILTGMIDRDRETRWAAEEANRISLGLHENLLALASFAYGIDKPTVRTLPDLVKDYLPSPSAQANIPIRDDVIAAMSGIEGGRIAPLEPDLLGEIHLIDRLKRIQDDGGEPAFRAFADAALTVGGEQAATVALRVVTDFPELMPQFGWMLPVRRDTREDVLRDARLAIDLVTEVPLPEVARLFDWFDDALDSAPDDAELALAASRTAWSFARRSARGPYWSYAVGRNADRLKQMRIDKHNVDEILFGRAIAMVERAVGRWPQDSEHRLTLARILRLLADVGTYEDWSADNMLLRAQAEAEAWRAMELAGLNDQRDGSALVRLWHPDRFLRRTPQPGAPRASAWPKPAGLHWQPVAREDSAAMLAIVAREAILDGNTAVLPPEGVLMAWSAELICAPNLTAWAFNIAGGAPLQLVLLTDGHRVWVCDGGSEMFHRLNDAGAFHFDSDAQVAEYLILFSSTLRSSGPTDISSDVSSFEIVQSSDDISLAATAPPGQCAALEQPIGPIRVERAADQCLADAFVWFDRYLFKVRMKVGPKGMVEMIDDEPLLELKDSVPNSFEGPYRRYEEANFSELAAQLLRDAATFFRSLGSQNAALEEQMTENASVFEMVATLAEDDPLSTVEEKPVVSLAAQLLRDAATFFDNVGDSNEEIGGQMAENATVFRQVANLIEVDPLGKPTQIVQS